MYSYTNSNLSKRLTTLSLSFALLIGIIISIFQLYLDFESEKVLIVENTQKVLVAFSPPAKRAVSTLDKKLASEVVQGISQYYFIDSAIILDDEGKILSQNSTQNSVLVHELKARQRDSLKQYSTKLPLNLYATSDEGELTVFVDFDKALAPFYERMMTVLFSGVFRNCFLCLALLLIFHIILTQPLKNLTAKINRLSSFRHELEPIKDPMLERDDELGSLGRSCNLFILKVIQLLEEKENVSASLRNSEERLLRIIDNLPQLIIAVNEEGKIVFANRNMCEYYEQDKNEIKGSTWHNIQNHDRAEFDYIQQLSQRVLKTKKSTADIILSLSKKGELARYFSTKFSYLSYFSQSIILISATDITKQVEIQRKNYKLATEDFLTSLPNRAALTSILADNSTAHFEDYFYSAMLFVDLDDFKTINDSLGHLTGDKLLIETSKILKSAIRENDIVARIGGDEFVILLDRLDKSENKANNIAEKISFKIQQRLNKPIKIRNNCLYISASIGIVSSRKTDKNKKDLLRYADTAMYKAKAQGRNRSVIFKHSMICEVERRQKLETKLRDAINNQKFHLVYQPQVDERGGCLGFEALVRWTDENEGAVSPGEFIPILENNRQIIELSNWIFTECCKQIRTWLNHGDWSEEWKLSINVSAVHFFQSDFLSTLDAIVREYKIPTSYLTLEITESVALVSLNSAKLILNDLKKRGFRIALDDFGTGYSSLSYLRELPIDILKIDRSFIQTMSGSDKQLKIVESILTMANHLELDVIAEGVEDIEQLNFLSSKNCCLYQGYLFYKPLLPSVLSKLFKNSVISAHKALAN